MGNTRYVIYVKPAIENLERLDGSLEPQIRSACEAFIDAWQPSVVFEKEVIDPVYQIKKNDTGLRAFGAHWSKDDAEILIVIAVYKKTDERDFWRRAEVFRETALNYFEVLDKVYAEERLGEWISNAEDSDDMQVFESV